MISLHTKFEISMFAHYEDMKGNAKCRNWSLLRVTQCHHSIQRVWLPIRL